MFGGSGNKTRAHVRGPHGQDLLKMKQPEFDTFMNTLCGTDQKVEAVDAIKAAIAAAAQMQEMNAIPTTDPKCHSVPVITVDRQCKVNVEWTPGSDDEVDCGM